MCFLNHSDQIIIQCFYAIEEPGDKNQLSKNTYFTEMPAFFAAFRNSSITVVPFFHGKQVTLITNILFINIGSIVNVAFPVFRKHEDIVDRDKGAPISPVE